MTIRLDSISSLATGKVDDLDQAATAFEAHFLRQMLAEVRGSSAPVMLDGGAGGRMFREMLDGALADEMAKAGGIGIAELLIDALGPATTSARGPAPLGRHASESYRSASAALTELPVEGEISSDFGRRTDPLEGDSRFHGGIDIACPVGTSVRSAGAGVVVRAGEAGGYGNLVVVDHGGGMETRYAHMAEIAVAVGDRIAAGAEVGAVGSTGRATGPHLHFEVRRGGKAVDPRAEIGGLK